MLEYFVKGLTKYSRRGLLGEIFDKLRIQCRMQIFEKMSQSALNQVLTLPDYRTQKMLQIPLKIIDLQNDFNILVAKQWKIRISVPMSYIRLFENLAVLEKWYGMESRSVMEPTVLLLVSFPCTIGFELRSLVKQKHLPNLYVYRF